MSLSGSRGSLTKLTKDLVVKWAETKEKWRDVKSLEFEEKYLADLPDTVNSTGTIIEELDKILRKIQNDCE